jgi:ABC-type glutathione transport system ATPase component
MILKVDSVTKEFTIESGMFGRPVTVRALRGVSFEVQEFETLGVVGESGSGKTTLAKIITGLVKPTAGSVKFDTQAISNFRKDVQIIFQNPFASLNPRMRVGEAVAEPMVIHRMARGRRLRERTAALLDAVGIPATAFSRFPAQFSGGQRQRICVARALACEPRFLVLDEPVSSLDLTVQLKLLELLARLKAEFKLTFIFISHNLGVIRFMAQRVMVMHGGLVVESGTVDDIFSRPREAYTRTLLEAARQR